MKRVLSLYELNNNNLMLYILYLIIKFTCAYFAIKHLHKFFYYIFSKLEKTKNIKFFTLFADAIFLLLNILEVFLIFYITNLISFNNLRHTIFELVNFNFSTNSNLRDLDSFKIFYCNENSGIYRDNNSNNKEFKMDQNYDENSKFNFDDTTQINSIKSYICFLTNFLDGFYLEYFLLFLIISNMFYKNFRSYYAKNYPGFSVFYKLYFFLLAILHLVYFFYVFLGISSLKKESLEKMKDKPKHEIDYGNYRMDDINSYRGNTYFESGNSNSDVGADNNELIRTEQDVEQTYSIWTFLGDVLGLLLEILD